MKRPIQTGFSRSRFTSEWQPAQLPDLNHSFGGRLWACVFGPASLVLIEAKAGAQDVEFGGESGGRHFLAALDAIGEGQNVYAGLAG